MSNMSYCRFQNTLHDLRDCMNHIEEDVRPDNYSGPEFEDDEEPDFLSRDEKEARDELVVLACEIAERYGNFKG